ncbi:MAG TPA: hypothetical protein VM101_10830 [Flavitalea sp.]|nr:hypothetical protein [Flavitalea sp.]
MKKIIVFIFILKSCAAFSQHGPVKDSTAFLDSIWNEMDDILDEMMPEKNYFTAGIGAGTGYFNFKNTSSETFNRQKKLMVTPTVSFYHKTGFGISATGYAVKDKKVNFYQGSVSPSYDYIQRGKLSTGIAFTRFFTKNDLSFYTTPVCNELSAYFSYKKFFIKPAVSLAYGWGSRTEYKKHKDELMLLRRFFNPGSITEANEESIRDLSILVSARKDLDFTDVLHTGDLFTITPVFAVSAGTQNFGLNSSFSSSKNMNNFVPANQYLKAKNNFDMQSATGVLRADYSITKFFVQTQFLLDYYLHLAPHRLNNAFAVIAGVNF